MTEAEERAAVLTEAMSWLRTPYHHRAGIKGVGSDCGQFVIGVYSNVGVIEKFDPGMYSHDHMLHSSEEIFLALVERYAYEVAAPKPGDMAVWRYGKCFSHIALVLEWPRMIHAYLREGGVVLGSGKTGEWGPPRRVRFYRLKGWAA